MKREVGEKFRREVTVFGPVPQVVVSIHDRQVWLLDVIGLDHVMAQMKTAGLVGICNLAVEPRPAGSPDQDLTTLRHA